MPQAGLGFARGPQRIRLQLVVPFATTSARGAEPSGAEHFTEYVTEQAVSNQYTVFG